MRTHVSEAPDRDAGKHLSALLERHKSESILLVLSGGSAFAILPHIDPNVLGPHVTICMADERFTRDEDGNNFLQLAHTDLYTQAQAAGCAFIDSTPHAHEPQHQFTLRMQEAFTAYMDAHPEYYAVGTFGIGEDGHTAGIFSTPHKEFTSLYRSGELYVSLTQTSAPYPFRATITPTFIEEVLDEVILYAVGKNKCENILDYMYNRTFEQHEVPALIPASHPQSTLFTDCPTLTP